MIIIRTFEVNNSYDDLHRKSLKGYDYLSNDAIKAVGIISLIVFPILMLCDLFLPTRLNVAR